MPRVSSVMAAESSDATPETLSFEVTSGSNSSARAAMPGAMEDEEATASHGSRGRDGSASSAQRPSSRAASTSSDHSSGEPTRTRGVIKENGAPGRLGIVGKAQPQAWQILPPPLRPAIMEVDVIPPKGGPGPASSSSGGGRSQKLSGMHMAWCPWRQRSLAHKIPTLGSVHISAAQSGDEA